MTTKLKLNGVANSFDENRSINNKRIKNNNMFIVEYSANNHSATVYTEKLETLYSFMDVNVVVEDNLLHICDVKSPLNAVVLVVPTDMLMQVNMDNAGGTIAYTKK